MKKAILLTGLMACSVFFETKPFFDVGLAMKAAGFLGALSLGALYGLTKLASPSFTRYKVNSLLSKCLNSEDNTLEDYAVYTKLGIKEPAKQSLAFQKILIECVHNRGTKNLKNYTSCADGASKIVPKK